MLFKDVLEAMAIIDQLTKRPRGEFSLIDIFSYGYDDSKLGEANKSQILVDYSSLNLPGQYY